METTRAPAERWPSSQQSGFSFMEVIIAMSVLIVGSVSILALFAIGVNHQVQRRIDARLEQVRPEVTSRLQDAVDETAPGKLPTKTKFDLSRRGYSLEVSWRTSPFDTDTGEQAPGILAHATLLYQGQRVRVLPPTPVTRSTLHMDDVLGAGKEEEKEP